MPQGGAKPGDLPEHPQQAGIPDREGALGTRYAMYGEIAAGGMASVQYGRSVGPRGFSRAVAITRLHAQFAKSPTSSACSSTRRGSPRA
jgi:hypothetical protein